MKNFLSTFVVCFIGCCVLLFFFASLLSNLWVLLTLAALFFAALITLFAHQEERMDALEKRLEQLEKGEKPPAAEELPASETL